MADLEDPVALDLLLPRGGVEKHQFAVIPAKAGIPELLKPMDSRLRGNDGEVEILHSSLARFVKEAKETRRVIDKTEPGKRRTEKCPGVMEQDREARDPARVGEWAGVGAGDGEVGLGRARGVLAFAQTAGKESPISWESPAST